MSLGPTSRNLVAAARGSLDPSAEIAARVKARVLAASVAPVAKAATLTSKLLALAAVTTVVLGVVVIRHRTAPSDPRIAFPVPAELVDEPQVEPHFSAATHSEAPAPVATRVAAVHVHAQPVKPVAAEPITLAREVQLLDAAMATSDPAGRLETLAIYDRETSGTGQLAEDAAALTIEARCRTHEPITEQIATFDQRWPRSVQRARIKAACF